MAGQTLYAFSADDVKILKETIDREKKRRVNPANRPFLTDYADYAPDTYVARAPSSGIPALQPGPPPIPGFADCTLYHMVNREISSIFADRTVYNLFQADILPYAWVLVTKDKGGTWWVIAVVETTDSPGTGTGTGSGTGTGTAGPGVIPSDYCNLARIKTSDCVVVHTGQKNYILTLSGDGWTSSEIFTPFAGTGVASGVFKFQYNVNTGEADLFLAGKRLLNCGDGCYAGGPLTGHVGNSNPGNCNGPVFIVCVDCTCCSIAGWAGPGWYCVEVLAGGTAPQFCDPLYLSEAYRCISDLTICSGPYATYALALAACPDPGTGSVSAPCDGVPTTITATLTVISGSCPDIDGKSWANNLVPLSSPKAWDSAADLDGTTSEFNGISVEITCNGGVWNFSSAGFAPCQFKDSGGTLFLLDNPGVIVSSTHIQFSGFFGGGFCTGCGDTFVGVIVDVTW